MAAADPIRLLVVSSVTPKPTGFGEITLQRHLINEPRLKVEVVPHPGVSRGRRLLRRTPLRGLAEGLELKGGGRRWDQRAQSLAESFRPQAILTIAAGDGCHAALRLAQKNKLPLISIFHDWWPDIAPAWVREGEEERFKQLYHGSTIALCVSEGMRRTLGKHPDSRILWPIPGQSSPPAKQNTEAPGKTFRIYYSGNLREYAPMLQQALTALKDHPSIRLEVRGMSPHWPDSFRHEMQAAGLYHEFAPREELERWLEQADAFLVTTSFDPAMRRMMETNFPSKLLEFARFGKPLVAWGPAYSSLMLWAQPTGRACCVTEADPAALRTALEKLAAAKPEQQHLAGMAAEAMKNEFDPATIQEQFLAAVRTAATSTSAR